MFADRLYLPSALVLSNCGITKAGDGLHIAAFCAHVVELDLSHNQLNDWLEVRHPSRVLKVQKGLLLTDKVHRRPNVHWCPLILSPLAVSQICTIVSNVPHLDFLNLSMNPLSSVELMPTTAEVFCRIRKLVLINTHVSWNTVHMLTRHMPE